MSKKAPPPTTSTASDSTYDWLLPSLPGDKIISRYRQRAGNEVDSGRNAHRGSSAALVANTFGFFLEAPEALPRLPAWKDAWSPIKLVLKATIRFPWSGGRHPLLDVLIETDTHVVGIESKRYEPFRRGPAGTFSKALDRPAWGQRMGPFEAIRDELKSGARSFQFLDAAQLVKHALGLRTHADKLGKKPVLAYLYAEPQGWPNGKRLGPAKHEAHAAEARAFSGLVEGSEVEFVSWNYQTLLETFESSSCAALREHGRAIKKQFDC
jgi:hypothetical protein